MWVTQVSKKCSGLRREDLFRDKRRCQDVLRNREDVSLIEGVCLDEVYLRFQRPFSCDFLDVLEDYATVHGCFVFVAPPAYQHRQRGVIRVDINQAISVATQRSVEA